MKSGSSRLLPPAILATLVASCAAVPLRPAAQGEEELLVSTGMLISTPGPSSSGPLGGKSLIAVEGVECALQNDKGGSIVTTPSIVRVARSEKPLVADCVKAGYRPAHVERDCHSPRALRNVQHPAATIPLGIIVAPVAPLSGLAVVTGAIHDISLGEDANFCTYGVDGAVVLTLEPQ